MYNIITLITHTTVRYMMRIIISVASALILLHLSHVLLAAIVASSVASVTLVACVLAAIVGSELHPSVALVACVLAAIVGSVLHLLHFLHVY